MKPRFAGWVGLLMATAVVASACTSAATPAPTQAPTAAPTSAASEGPAPTPAPTELPGTKNFTVGFTNAGISSAPMIAALDRLNQAGWNIEIPIIESSELVVHSGVFTISQGAWTVPVEISASGQPTMAAPDAAGTFKQGMNNYHSAKVGLYSEATGRMHQWLFGGISLQFLDETTGQVITDNAMPFVNDITSIVSDVDGSYTQYHLGSFPELFDGGGNRLRFGTNAEFFPAAGVERYSNGVLSLDALTDETVVGYTFGGIVANVPHTRGVEDAVSVGSNRIFEVVVSNVPEPSGRALVIGLFVCWAAIRKR